MIKLIFTLTVLTLLLFTLSIFIKIGLKLAEQAGVLLKRWGLDFIQIRAAWITHKADETRLGLELERERDKLEFVREQAQLQIVKQRLTLQSGQSNKGP